MYTERSHALDPYAPQEAWPPVLDAIAEAMDVPGLPPEDRAQLAGLYELAQPFADERVLYVSDVFKPTRGGEVSHTTVHRAVGDGPPPTAAEWDAWHRVRDVIDGPGGIHELAEHLPSRHRGVIFRALKRTHALHTVEAVAAATDVALSVLDGMGPIRVAVLRDAVAAHRAEAKA